MFTPVECKLWGGGGPNQTGENRMNYQLRREARAIVDEVLSQAQADDEPLNDYERTSALWRYVEKLNQDKKFDDRRLVYVAEENSHDVSEEEWLECAIGTVNMYVDGEIDDPWVLADE